MPSCYGQGRLIQVGFMSGVHNGAVGVLYGYWVAHNARIDNYIVQRTKI